MNPDDRNEVIAIVKESAKIISTELKTGITEAIEKQTVMFSQVMQEQKEDFRDTLINALQEQRKEFKEAMQEQTNIFLKVLDAYEKRADKHEKNFQNIKKSIDTEEAN